MKYLITEEQDIRLSALRRLSIVDTLIKIKLEEEFNFDCNYGAEGLLENLVEWTNEIMYYNYFSDIDDDTDEWHKIWNIYYDYITTTYAKEIFDLYDKKCGK
jgi:hypothetical protein